MCNSVMIIPNYNSRTTLPNVTESCIPTVCWIYRIVTELLEEEHCKLLMDFEAITESNGKLLLGYKKRMQLVTWMPRVAALNKNVYYRICSKFCRFCPNFYHFWIRFYYEQSEKRTNSRFHSFKFICCLYFVTTPKEKKLKFLKYFISNFKIIF